MFFSVIIFIATLLILVLIHELGHFILAKKFGIKVEEFGFGIPPRAWGKKIGETIYSLNWLPLGGFVRLLGEDGVDGVSNSELKNTINYDKELLVRRGIIQKKLSKSVMNDPRSFAAANVWKRIIVVFAGVCMNLVFAILLFYIILFAKGFKYQIPLLIDHNFIGAEQKIDSRVFIADIVKDSPAEIAGMKPGLQIIALNGETITEEQKVISETKALAGQEIQLTLQDPQSQKITIVKATPRQNPPKGQGALGLALSEVRLVNLEYKTPVQKIFSGPSHAWNVTTYSLQVFGKLIQQSFATKSLAPVSETVAGPVGITTLANTILTSTDKPLIPYLDFVAMISLNLAIMNLLPIPALDGGRLFFLLIEALLRKKVHAGFEKWVHMVGMVLLLLLTLVITISDIKRLLP